MLLLLLLSAAAEPTGDQIAVVISRRAAVAPPRAQALQDQLERALAASQLALLPGAETQARLKRLGFPDATFCAGKRQCLGELAKQLPAGVVVGLSLAEVKPDLAVNVEAVRPDGTRLAQQSSSGPASTLELSATFEAFAKELAAAIAPQPAPAPAPALVAEVPPPPAPAPPAVVNAPAAPRPKWPALLSGGAAVASLVAGVALGAHAFVEQDALRSALAGPPSLTFEAANARLRSNNTELSAAIGFAAGALVLAVLALVLWPGASP